MEDQKIRHLDLFAGIGGFSIASEAVWGKGNVEHIFCEINQFCCSVLRNQFGKDITIYGDIRGLTAYTNSDRCTGRGAGIDPTISDEQAFGDAQGGAEPSGVPFVLSDGIGRDERERDREGRQVLSTPERAASENQQERDRRVDRLGAGDRIDLLTGGFPCQPFSQAGKRKGVNDDRFLWPEMLRVIREFKPTWVVAENVRGLLTISEGMVFEQVCADLEREGYEVQPFVIPACAVNAPHRRDRVWIVAKSTSKRSDTRWAECERLEGRVRRHERPSDEEAPTARSGWEADWLEVATRFCGVDDGLPERLYFLNGLGYTPSKGDDYEESDGTETEPKICESVWKGMRKVWSEWLSKQAPCQDAEEGDNDSLRPVPCKGTPKEWDAPSEEAEELRGMWQRFYAASFQEAQDLFPELLERIREIERKKKVGCSLNLSKAGHRVERLKALGNAIVPQVAIQIFRGLKMAEVMESL